MEIYVVTGPNTSDFPGVYTVRRQVIGAGTLAIDTAPIGHAPTLEEARKLIPPGLVRFNRESDDNPVIVESWL